MIITTLLIFLGLVCVAAFCWLMYMWGRAVADVLTLQEDCRRILDECHALLDERARSLGWRDSRREKRDHR